MAQAQTFHHPPRAHGRGVLPPTSRPDFDSRPREKVLMWFIFANGLLPAVTGGATCITVPLRDLIECGSCLHHGRSARCPCRDLPTARLSLVMGEPCFQVRGWIEDRTHVSKFPDYRSRSQGTGNQVASARCRRAVTYNRVSDVGSDCTRDADTIAFNSYCMG